jgi:hypothetical protein
VTIDEVRRTSIGERLDGLLVDVERYQADAFDAGDIDDAVRWYTIAAALRGTLAMLNAGGDNP